MGIKFVQMGSFKSINVLVNRMANDRKKLKKYANKGLEALRNNTPVRTGKTAASWNLAIKETNDRTTILWFNTNTSDDGIPIVTLLYYGHATSSGKYIPGKDFISPAIDPIFDMIINDV